MKIVQTFWSANKSDILNDAFGWYHAQYHIQSWALSCQLLRRLYDDVELYTDKAGYDLLIEKLQLPYTKVHVVLDELNHYSSAVWALSKIRTYSLQDTPFIHIDGDVFLWEKFSDRLTNSDLVIQNREIGNQYFDTSWKTLEEQLSFIPDEIVNHRQKEPAVNVYNFGIFGGKNTEFIQEYSRKAFDFVNRNLNSLDAIKHLNFNIFFEQYLCYCMAQDQQVGTYFPHDIVADKYEGLANFQDVPTTHRYLHLLGDYKKKEEICRNMSRQLAVEFPEQYLTCLKVLGSQEQKVFSLQYKGIQADSTQEQSSFAEYYQSVSEANKFSKTQKALEKYLRISKEKEVPSIKSKEDVQKVVENLRHLQISKVFQYDVKIDSYLNSLANLDFKEYTQSEYKQQRLYPQFLRNNEGFQFKSVSVHTMIEESFLFGDTPLPDGEDMTAPMSRLIIPSSNAPYYKEIVLDTLEEIVFNESKSGTNIQQLMTAMQNYFDAEELRNNYASFELLIRNTTKRLIYLGALSLIDEK